MNIVLGEEHIKDLESKYVVLELDTFRVIGQLEPVTAYCIAENLAVGDIIQADKLRDLHNNLMKNYRLKNWSYCEQALEHLQGKWRGQLDSFYQSLSQRISDLREQKLDPQWDGILDRR